VLIYSVRYGVADDPAHTTARRYSLPTFNFSRFLNIRMASGATLSPAGDEIAFLYDVTGVPQVWKVFADGGWPEQLTFFPERVSALEWSPSGGHIFFGMDAGGNERQGLYALSPDGAECLPLETDPDVIHYWGAWSPDGAQIAYTSNARDRSYFDVYTRPLDGESKRVLQQDGTNTVEAWSPDGRRLLVSRATTNLDNDLYLLDLESGDARLLTEHRDEALYLSPNFVGEDELILLANADSDFLAPARLDLRTGSLARLEEPGWDVEYLAASPDGRVVAYAVNEDGYSRITVYVDGDNVQTSGLPSGVVSGLQLSAEGSVLAIDLNTPTTGANVWTMDPATGEAVQVTRASLAGIAPEALVEPELVRYASFDGLEVPAFLYKPVGVEPPYPVVVHVHGGPESQAVPNLHPTIQYLVHRGFGVLATNVRGSTGYGKAYTHLDDVRKRMDSVADLEAAVRWLRDSGQGDPGRIAVMGGSYGGFMTLAAITTYPDLWAAAVNTVGIANFVTFLENTGPWRRRLRESEYGSLEQDRDFLEEISPINHVERIAAPMLVIHGANDPRVPIGEAEQIVERLQGLGREVEYLRYEDEGHGLVKLNNRIHAAEATAAFLDNHIGGGATS